MEPSGRATHWVWLGAGLAALLLFAAGFALGRLTVPREETEEEETERLARLLRQERWAEAAVVCSGFRAGSLIRSAAACARARTEQEAKGLYDRAYAAALASQHLEAVRLQEMIPSGSSYKKRNLELFLGARSKFLAAARPELDRLASAGACPQARELAQQIYEIDPGDTAALARGRRCGGEEATEADAPTTSSPDAGPPAVETPAGLPAAPERDAPEKSEAPAPSHKRRPAPPARPAAPTEPAAPPLSPQEIQELIAQARQAYVSGRHADAVRIAKRALGSSARNSMALQILGASSCYLRDERQARWALDRLPSSQRELLRTICIKYGIAFE